MYVFSTLWLWIYLLNWQVYTHCAFGVSVHWIHWLALTALTQIDTNSTGLTELTTTVLTDLWLTWQTSIWLLSSTGLSTMSVEVRFLNWAQLTPYWQTLRRLTAIETTQSRWRYWSRYVCNFLFRKWSEIGIYIIRRHVENTELWQRNEHSKSKIQKKRLRHPLERSSL